VALSLFNIYFIVGFVIKKIELRYKPFILCYFKMNPMLINVWFVSIIMLLVMANSNPVAFNYAVFVFVSPFVTIVCSVLFSIIPNDIWYGFGLMCLFLWTRFVVLP
jgi:hypothetical protein